VYTPIVACPYRSSNGIFTNSFSNRIYSNILRDLTRIQNISLKMLTELENRIALQIFSICCKSFTVPFTVVSSEGDLKVSVTPSKRFYRRVVWTLLMLTAIFRINKFYQVILNLDPNEAILHGLFLMTSLYHFVLKLNLIFHKEEFQIMDRVLQMNSIWGKHKSGILIL